MLSIVGFLAFLFRQLFSIGIDGAVLSALVCALHLVIGGHKPTN
jgi:hypothetical protein